MKCSIRIISLALFCCTVGVFAQDDKPALKGTSFFNEAWLKTLVSIEVHDEKGKGKPIGSGFLVQTPQNHIVVVTAKHVVFEEQGKGPLIENLAYRLNDKKGHSRLVTDAHATTWRKSTWLRSPKHDAACRMIVWGNEADFMTIPYSMFLRQEQIAPGAPVYVIGFPMGLRSEEYATPIVRRGIIARSDEHGIIADVFVFPGNSGGPVVYAPLTPFAEGGIIKSPVLEGQWLLGLVSSYVPYVDVAVSQQTRRPRVTFEENSGLSHVITADSIMTLLSSDEFKKIDEKKQ